MQALVISWVMREVIAEKPYNTNIIKYWLSKIDTSWCEIKVFYITVMTDPTEAAG